MKYREFHKKIEKEGWKFSHAEGSHYFYLKNGRLSPPIPFHGAKEIGEGLRIKIGKEMGLK
jgi:predicted RNA binding protein YcfA (HicA-like mRNA interferase family)